MGLVEKGSLLGVDGFLVVGNRVVALDDRIRVSGGI